MGTAVTRKQGQSLKQILGYDFSLCEMGDWLEKVMLSSKDLGRWDGELAVRLRDRE